MLRLAGLVLPAVFGIALCGCVHAAAGGPPSTPSYEPLPEALWRHWIHSFEDDASGVRAYRPEGYAFPPARGREGFRLERDGRYVEYAIARGDGNTEKTGTWERVGPDTLEVRAGSGAAERLQILSVTDGLLKVKAAR